MVFAASALSAGCQPELMPTPNLYATAGRDPFPDVPPDARSNRVEVVYATDRAPFTDRKGGLCYGFQRSPSLAMGLCTVEIGRGVSWDELVRDSRTNRRRRGLPLTVVETRERLRFPPVPTPMVEDGGKLVENPEALAQEAESVRQLVALFADRLRGTPHREVYLFVHGYNNEFPDGILVMAQLWHFLGRTGVPVVYTWPAGSPFGLLRGYNHDRESGEFTIYHLKQFLRALASCPELRRMHLIAHSRGTDVLTSALRELHSGFRAAGKDTRSELKIGNMILAAPDLDIEVMQQRIAAERLHLIPERLTVYISEHDRAIGIADWLFGSSRRLGQLRGTDLTPSQRKALGTLAQLQLVDVKVKTDWLGHSYFYGSPAVSSDVILVLRDNRAPGAEHGRPLLRRYDNFWEMRDDYLGAAPSRDGASKK